jgi:hypothetical protein
MSLPNASMFGGSSDSDDHDRDMPLSKADVRKRENA